MVTKAILEERVSRYGLFSDNSNITQSLMNVIEKSPAAVAGLLSNAHKEAIHMIMHKVSRCVCGDPNYVDNFVDIAGYAKLMVKELKLKECEKK